MNIFLNEEPCIVNSDVLSSILEELNLTDKKGIAVAVNDNVVGRSRWNEFIIKENDKILIITATRGG